jgi:hypothetical protein
MKKKKIKKKKKEMQVHQLKFKNFDNFENFKKEVEDSTNNFNEDSKKYYYKFKNNSFNEKDTDVAIISSNFNFNLICNCEYTITISPTEAYIKNYKKINDVGFNLIRIGICNTNKYIHYNLDLSKYQKITYKSENNDIFTIKFKLEDPKKNDYGLKFIYFIMLTIQQPTSKYKMVKYSNLFELNNK